MLQDHEHTTLMRCQSIPEFYDINSMPCPYKGEKHDIDANFFFSNLTFKIFSNRIWQVNQKPAINTPYIFTINVDKYCLPNIIIKSYTQVNSRSMKTYFLMKFILTTRVILMWTVSSWILRAQVHPDWSAARFGQTKF